MSNKSENLNELLSQFLDASEAQQAAWEIEQGEKCLAQFPAPPPNPRLIANIKTRMCRQLRTKKTVPFKKPLWQVASAAAIIVLASTLIVWMVTQSPIKNPTSGFVWDSNDIMANDAKLATYNAEVVQLENELAAIESADMYDSSQQTLNNLEMEFLEIDSDFWKG